MSDDDRSFEELNDEAQASLPYEFWIFLTENKKWWMLPIVIVLLAVGLLAIVGAGTGATPFIYTLF